MTLRTWAFIWWGRSAITAASICSVRSQFSKRRRRISARSSQVKGEWSAPAAPPCHTLAPLLSSSRVSATASSRCWALWLSRVRPSASVSSGSAPAASSSAACAAAASNWPQLSAARTTSSDAGSEDCAVLDASKSHVEHSAERIWPINFTASFFALLFNQGYDCV